MEGILIFCTAVFATCFGIYFLHKQSELQALSGSSTPESLPEHHEIEIDPDFAITLAEKGIKIEIVGNDVRLITSDNVEILIDSNVWQDYIEINILD